MTRRPVSPDIKAFVDQGFSCWNGGEIDVMADSYAHDAEVDTTTALPEAAATRGASSSSGTSTSSGMRGTACT